MVSACACPETALCLSGLLCQSAQPHRLHLITYCRHPGTTALLLHACSLSDSVKQRSHNPYHTSIYCMHACMSQRLTSAYASVAFGATSLCTALNTLASRGAPEPMHAPLATPADCTAAAGDAMQPGTQLLPGPGDKGLDDLTHGSLLRLCLPPKGCRSGDFVAACTYALRGEAGRAAAAGVAALIAGALWCCECIAGCW